MLAFIASIFATLAGFLTGISGSFATGSIAAWAAWLVYTGPLYVTVPTALAVGLNVIAVGGKVLHMLSASSTLFHGLFKLITLPSFAVARLCLWLAGPFVVVAAAVAAYLKEAIVDVWGKTKRGAQRNWVRVRDAAIWNRIRTWCGSHIEWMVATCFAIGLIIALARYWRSKRASKRLRKEALNQRQLNMVDYTLNVLNVLAAVVGVAAFGWDAAKRAGFTSWVLRTWRSSMGAGGPRDFSENERKGEKKKIEAELEELAKRRAQFTLENPLARQDKFDVEERGLQEQLRAVNALSGVSSPFVRPGLGAEEEFLAREEAEEPLPVSTFKFFTQYGTAFLVVGAFTAIILGLLYWVIDPEAADEPLRQQGKERVGRVRREGELSDMAEEEEEREKIRKLKADLADVRKRLESSKGEEACEEDEPVAKEVTPEAKGDNKNRALRRNPSPDDVDLAELARDYEEAQAALEEAERRWELRLDSYAVEKESMKTDLEKKFADYGVEMRKMDKVMNQLAEKTGATLVKLDTDISLLNRKMVELADRIMNMPQQEALVKSLPVKPQKVKATTCGCGRPLGETNRTVCPDCWKQKKAAKKAAAKQKKEALGTIEWTEVPVKKEALIASSALIQPTNQNAVVKISGKNPSSQVDFKNGFVANGTLVTCYHGPSSDLQVESPQFGLPLQAVNLTDAKTDAKADWAMFTPPKGSPSTATCRQPKLGEKCFIRFYAGPDATGLTMSEGIVESVGDGAAGLNGHHTCSTVRMASGAPVFAVTDGKIIGIHIGSQGQTNVFWPINANGPSPRVSWLNKPGN